MRKRSAAGGKKAKARHRTALKSTRRKVRVAKPPGGAIEKPEIALLTRELDDARDQQMAMSEVLHAISRSKFDLSAVLESVAEAAARLCRSDGAVIFQLDGGVYRFAAGYSLLPAYLEIERKSIIAPGPGTVVGRAAMTRQVIRIDDLLSDPHYELKEESKAEGNRSMIGVPLLRDGEPVVVIGLGRRRIDPFGDREIELATTFAAQAMIAIENARLLNELRQSLEQQKAASEVLQAISSAPGDLEPIFTTMLEKATRICEAEFAALYRLEGDGLRLAATYNVPPAFAQAEGMAFQPAPGGALDEAMKTGRTTHISDLAATRSYVERHPRAVEAVEIAGIRTSLCVPMVKDNELIGIIGVFRQQVRPFNDKQIELVTDFAAQAVIAIESARLLNELRGRTTDLTEALEQQTATSDVLRIVSSSPGDLQPVFAAILENAVRICDANFGNIYRWDGDALHIVATHKTPAAFAEERRRSPYRPNPNSPIGHMLAAKTLVHIRDITTEEAYIARSDVGAVATVELAGTRTLLGVPLLNKGEMLGAFFLSRQAARPFTDKQIDLVKNFAVQAAIAIENARLLNELRQSLERQTATSDVLEVISSSPGDLEPVFAIMLGKAVSICDAKFGMLYFREGDKLRLIAVHGVPPAFAEAQGKAPFHPAPDGMLDAVMRTGRTVHLADLAQARSYIERDPRMVEAVEIGGIRSVLGVPLIKDDELIGLIGIYRQEVRPFTDEQIEVLTNFAAQAVIAIENARLLNELRQRTTDLGEALEQQTGASEVLEVISSSTGDLEPVFESLLRNATQLCKAGFGTLYLCEEGRVRLVAAHDMPAEFSTVQSSDVTEPAPGGPLDAAIKAKKAVQIPDLAATEAYRERHPRMVDAVELGGIRTVVAVPMLKDDEPIGVIAVHRRDVLPFNDKQIALLTSFAAQAVIAIENARLLNELRQRTADLSELLEQQTATSDVLKVISSSPGDLEPVFAALLENAVRLCDAKFGSINRWDGEALHVVATRQLPQAFAAFRERSPFRPGPENPIGRMLMTKAVVHVHDLAAEQGYADRNPTVVAAVEIGGIRTLLAVPMLKESELIGALIVYSQEIHPFTDKQIDLVKNFAAQAVIAIENARLLNELRQRTNDLTESLEQQTATSEVLQVISSSPGELEPVFAAMLASATHICEAKFGNLFLREAETFRAVAWHGEPTYVESWRGEALIIRTDLADIPLSRVAATKQRVHVADLTQEAAYKAGFAPIITLVDKGGARTLLIVPMLKEHALVGAIAMYRQEVRPFTDKQIALVENFAAQAVIAIENARLLRELRERTEEVEKLNQQLEHRVADQVGEIERMGRLRRFLPPQVADLIVASGAEKQLESHRREITALFCDLRGFTGFSESADPEDVMALLREYHAALGEIINKYSGTLERYAGDGVMVVFNDPVPVENPALQAVMMALDMRDAIGALTGKWRRRGHDIGFGIGIAHGFATLGTIGFEGRFDYAAIGTVSNVASRLCDEAKPGQILISPRVLMEIEDAIAVEPVGEFELKGIRRPLVAYNVLAARSGQQPQAGPAD